MNISTPTWKAVSVGILIVICLIPTLFVFAIVSDRKDRDRDVRAQIGSEWGAPQEFFGPILTIPYKRTQLVDGKNYSNAGELYLFPSNYNLSVTLDPSEKQRGIFRIPVYHAQLKGAAEFPEFSRYQLNEPGVVYEFDRAFIAFPFSDARSIDPKSVVQVNEKDTMIAPGHGMNKIFEGTRGVHVQAQTVSKNQRVDFSLELAGNEHLSFVPSGDTSLISVSSQLGSPSFSGAYLPKTSSVGGTGFTANWEISSLGRSFAHALFSENAPEQSISETLVETKLYEGVDHYALVERSIKYAILFITLTFMAFFFIEILNRLRVHPIQYLLIGVALGVFYLLLLSFSEQMIFPYAYALSSAMTILLISIYSRSVLKAGKHAWTVGGVLVLLYSYLYMVLNSEDYALLAGTLLLFAVLTFTMFITRKVNWYAIGTETAVKE